MRRLLLCCALLAAGTAQAAGSWSELWQTPDQRGEALLREGQPAAAAKVFSDPRQRAHAQLKAGDYAAAAKGFAAFDDRDAHYDRGNALARAGDLPGALKAYDAALKLDPQDKDARHNRDLVAKAMEQHQQPGDKPPPPKDSKRDDPSKPEAASSPSAPSSQPKPSEAPGSAASSSPQQQQQQQQEQQQRQPSEPQPAGPAASEPAADSEAQAKRDVAPEAASAPARAATAASATRSERELAEDQWLRRIPDDPGGLLRRKFMIQHMQRQQSRQQADPDAETPR